MSTAIQVEDLTVRYGDTVAVDDVTFELRHGKVLALLGPNGAGKTSTVEVCEGYRRASAGQVRVLGLDPFTEHDRLTPRIGIMLQSGGVYPRVSAADMLRLFASFAAHPLPVDVLVERLELGRFLHTPYIRLSGGERQRLAMALALVGRPEVVFLDEPTAGMDLRARHRTWDLVREMRTDGVAVLLTTHLLDEAERLADDVLIIDRGGVLAAGSPEALTGMGGIGRLTVAATAGLPVATLSGGLTAVEEPAGNYQIDGALDTAALAVVLAWFLNHGATVTGLRTESRTLEDVFLELTAKEPA